MTHQTDDVVDADGNSSASRAMQCHNYLSSSEALVECIDSIGWVTSAFLYFLDKFVGNDATAVS